MVWLHSVRLIVSLEDLRCIHFEYKGELVTTNMGLPMIFTESNLNYTNILFRISITFSTSYFMLSIISYTLFFFLSFLLHLNFFFMVDAYKILQQNRKNQLWFHYINSHFNFSMFIFFSSFVAMAYILSQILIWSFMTFVTMNSINLSLKGINSLHF